MDSLLGKETGPFVNALPKGEMVADGRVSQIDSLLEQLGASSDEIGSSAQETYEGHLAEVRLGIVSSLFTALRCKHPATAAHSLRVALRCSSWGFVLELNDTHTRQLEVAALLHDIGKIAVPDAILLKPGQLAPDELAVMQTHRVAALKILRGCCESSTILDIVRYLPAWYDGSRPHYPILGHQIPLGARILSIVDAFDSMTSDQVYRKALSHERALNELFAFAGSQFDPELVEQFSRLHHSEDHFRRVASRWLKELQPVDPTAWESGIGQEDELAILPESLFQKKLLDSMHDAVAFIDLKGKILLWNRGAERLTGISATAICQNGWSPGLIGLCDETGRPLRDSECPIAQGTQTSVQSLRRYIIRGRQGQPIAVDLHAMPVVGADGTVYGAAIVLHDASPEASLEQRCQSLHERATKDPLTQVANRAEFDRTHKMFVAAHLERQLPCSLIICDLDHFKQINDNFGHQAGDEALKAFAHLLKRSCRPGDLVARYGGEEFVILCADCVNGTATQRADQIRRAISELPQPSLDGRVITASFGVTEIQAGDTADTMLRRADRALLEAKQRGRNTVVQLGVGIAEIGSPGDGFFWFQKRNSPPRVLEKWFVTAVPMKMTLEKVRGFVADHHAEILSVEGDKVGLRIDSGRAGLLHRRADRPVSLIVELRFSEERNDDLATTVGRVCHTRVHVAIRPRRQRDGRRNNLMQSARQVASSLKSYLMAADEECELESTLPSRARSILIPWLREN